MADDLIVYVTVSEGIPGVGVPAGGSTGEVLTKVSDADYDTDWGPGGGGGGSIAIGTTPITGGTSGRVLYDNAGVAGELATTGSGSVVLSTSPTLVTPALGTPSSATLTNATGLPISTGVSGLGTGVATALGVNVGSAGAPVVNGGALGTPSSGNLSNCTGYPISGVNTNDTLEGDGSVGDPLGIALTLWSGGEQEGI